jgi:hypothetical protein
MEPQQIAVLARDPVTLGDLGGLSGDVGDSGELARRRPDAHDRRDREAELPRAQLGVVARDHAGPLEPLNALGDGGRRHPDATAKLGHAETTVRL